MQTHCNFAARLCLAVSRYVGLDPWREELDGSGTSRCCIVAETVGPTTDFKSRELQRTGHWHD